MSSPLRACVDVSAIPPSPKGAGRYVVELMTALGSRDDIDLTVISRRDDRDRWTFAPARVKALAPVHRPTRLLFEEFGLGWVVDHGRPRADVFFGPHYTMPMHCVLPRVVTVHDLTMIEHPEWHERTKVLVFKRAMRRAAAKAAGIIFVSEATRTGFFSSFSPVGKTFVIPHGLDHELFAPQEPRPGADASVLARLSLSRPFVLAVGTIEPRKNHPTLVRAFTRLWRSDPTLSLVIAGGRGWGAQALDAEIAASDARQNIFQLGYVADGDLAALYRSSSLCCYPSFEEGFGLPALEALACATPLVTTSGSAMDDLGAAAAIFVTDPGDDKALAEAMDRARTPDESRRLEGIAVASRYSWQRSAAAHVEAFSAVAAR